MALFVGMCVIISLLRLIIGPCLLYCQQLRTFHLHAEHQCNVPLWQSNMCFSQIALLPLILFIRLEHQIRANASSILNEEAPSLNKGKKNIVRHDVNISRVQ